MSDNSLPASPRKIDKAKRQGQVARSPELVSETILLWGLFVLSVVLGAPAGLLHWFRGSFDACLASANDATLGAGTLKALGLSLGPALALLALVAGGNLILALVINQLVAGGTKISWETLQPNFDRIKPGRGLTRMVSGGAWGTAGLSLIKMAAALTAVGLMIPKLAMGVMDAQAATPEGALGLAAKRFLSVGFTVAGSLAGFAVLQAFWARKRWVDELKMSRHEAVEDAKESEGDPRTKRRHRTAHRKLARRRTVQAVAASDVVLANPTHVAVALRYKRGRMRAPRVMAKGADLMAVRIKEAARALGIPVVEQAPLARDLYASVAVGREIPSRLYRAVARVIHQIRGLQAPRPAAPTSPYRPKP